MIERVRPTHFLLANVRVRTPLIHGFYHYDYNAAGQLVRWPIRYATFYRTIWRQTMALQSWYERLGDGPNARIVRIFLSETRDCDGWRDPSHVLSLPKVLHAATAASCLQGKKALKAGFETLLTWVQRGASLNSSDGGESTHEEPERFPVDSHTL